MTGKSKDKNKNRKEIKAIIYGFCDFVHNDKKRAKTKAKGKR
jgi:hypothetical protein